MVQPDMGLHACIDAVERTVVIGRDLQRAGHLEDRTGSRRSGENHIGTAARALTDQGDPAGLIKDGGHQIAAGEGRRGNEAVQVILTVNRIPGSNNSELPSGSLSAMPFRFRSVR